MCFVSNQRGRNSTDVRFSIAPRQLFCLASSFESKLVWKMASRLASITSPLKPVQPGDVAKYKSLLPPKAPFREGRVHRTSEYQYFALLLCIYTANIITSRPSGVHTTKKHALLFPPPSYGSQVECTRTNSQQEPKNLWKSSPARNQLKTSQLSFIGLL